MPDIGIHSSSPFDEVQRAIKEVKDKTPEEQYLVSSVALEALLREYPRSERYRMASTGSPEEKARVSQVEQLSSEALQTSQDNKSQLVRNFFEYLRENYGYDAKDYWFDEWSLLNKETLSTVDVPNTLTVDQKNELVEEIGKLKFLTNVEFTGFELDSFPVTVTELPNLQHLDLSFNSVTAIPPEVGNLSHLETLDLSGNLLTTLPEELKNCADRLTILRLESNPLQYSGEGGKLGLQELREIFGERLVTDDPNVEFMSATTRKDEVDELLDSQPFRINRKTFASLKPPPIPEVPMECKEMVSTFETLLASMNLTDPDSSPYLTYELLSGDWEAEVGKSNEELVMESVAPHLSGYVRALYNEELEASDKEPVMMLYDEFKNEGQRILSYIISEIAQQEDKDTQMLRFVQLVNGMIHCHTGQSEAFNALAYSMMGVEQRADLAPTVQQLVAREKNLWFTTAILSKGVDNTQNVHLIAPYREDLSEVLGLNTTIEGFEDRVGQMGTDPFNDNPANAYQVYFELVTPQRVTEWVQNSIETAADRSLKTDFKRAESLLNKLQEPQKVHPLIARLETSLEKTQDPELRAAYEQQIEALRGQSTSPPESFDELDALCEKYDTTRENLLPLLKLQVKEALHMRPISCGEVLRYVVDENLVNQGEKDWWKLFFTADPISDASAIPTGEGLEKILVHMNILIDEEY